MLPSQRREPHRLIRKRQVLAKTGDSQSTWYKLVQEERAPSPVKISDGCVAWYEPDIDDLIDARPLLVRPRNLRVVRHLGAPCS